MEARQQQEETPENKEERRRFAEEASSLWLITLSPLAWAIHFILSYGGAALYCARFAPAEFDPVPFMRLSIAGITVLALAVIGYVAWVSWRQWDYLDDYDYDHAKAVGEDRHEFLGHAAFLLSIMSAIAVIYVAMPAIFMETCR
ncbi:hypothetical protein D8780_09625 [Notoacmeibacter ruber]|uniref:Uncharacterized protein n=1 Tax=Notoacmeibacter ruber TaxID=2670375 RepID=A0A3L7JFG7_9HYPH|nr:hypothetical protein D8780_09625 [Notoacmeibacter ruber]